MALENVVRQGGENLPSPFTLIEACLHLNIRPVSVLVCVGSYTDRQAGPVSWLWLMPEEYWLWLCGVGDV